jgi:predicted ester cyclase
MACYQDDMSFASGSGERLEGKTAFRERIAANLAMWPDAHLAIDRVVAEGDKVAVEWTLSGTNTAEIQMPTGGPPIPPTGKSVLLGVATVYEVRGGLIASEHEYVDTGLLFSQLGLA